MLIMPSLFHFIAPIRLFSHIQNLKWKVPKGIIQSLRIICTDSKLQNVHNCQLQHRNDLEPLCFPVTHYKDNTKVVDCFHSRQTSLLNECQTLDELLKSREFKEMFNRTSFCYDVNLVGSCQTFSPSLYFSSLEDTYSSTKYLYTENNNENKYKVCMGEESDAKSSGTGKPSESQLLTVIDVLTKSLLNFFEKSIDTSIYHQNIVFHNNIKGITVKGLTAYTQAMNFTRIYGFLQYARIKFEILKITHHIEDGTVRIRWRVKGVSRHKLLTKFWKLRFMSWDEFVAEEADWLDAFSVFSVGSDGLVYKHVCDKMMPDDNTAVVKSDLKSRLLGLFQLGPRPAGSLNALVPCYKDQDLTFYKKFT